ncbi:MAG: Calx-beta domain-containing protein [Cyanobacteria bacterium P01_H01_bin.152]
MLQGRDGNDAITGGSNRDLIEGGDGNDIIRGGAGDDNTSYLNTGVYGTTRGGLYGGEGDDEIYGEGGNDALFGGTGNDLLVGVDQSNAAPGLSERDNLSGGAGEDRFILGDANWIGYDDRNTNTSGTNDYALITDFNPAEDTIQLQGPSSNYRLGPSPFSQTPGTALYLDKPGDEPDELIAIIQGSDDLDLAAAGFVFVNPVIELVFASESYSVNEDGTAEITIVRNGNTESEVSATVTLSGETATAPADFNGTAIPITFAPGETSQIITVPIVDDAAFESDETLTLSLTNLTGGATVGLQGTTTLTILDNDSPIPGSLAFSRASFRVNEDGTPVTAVTVIRTGGSDGEVSVTVTPTDGTASAPDDYTSTPVVVTFADGETQKVVEIPIADDASPEATETVNLTLSEPTGGASLGDRDTATLSILDNEVQLFFSAANYTVREDGTAITQIRIDRAGDPSQAVEGKIVFTDGTAEGCGCAASSVNNDFHNGAIAFTLAENETSKVIPVELASLGTTGAIRIRDDGKVEGNETFTISLSELTGGATVGERGSAIVTILDDDIELAFTAPTFEIQENGTATAAVTVQRLGDTTKAVSATLNLTDGTATAPADYDNTPILVEFAPGETSQVVPIPVRNDIEVESDETVTLSLSDPTGGAVLGSQNTTVLTILDNGSEPTLGVTLDQTVVAEDAGEGAVTGTVTRNIVTNDALVVTLNSSDTSEATVPETVTILPGEASATFSLSPVNDGIADGVQNATVSAAATGFNTGTAAIAVSDVDIPDLVVTTLEPTSAFLTGQTATFSYRVENQGFTAANGTWRDRLYLSTDALLDASDILLSDNSITAEVAPGLSYERETTIFAPRRPGQYYLIAETDADGAIDEGGSIGDSNNLRVTPVTVAPAYQATVSTEFAMGVAGSPILLSGQAFSTVDNAPVPFEFVTVAIKNNGFERLVDTFTDANGDFELNFVPLPGEGGQYEINAYFPDNPAEDVAAEDSFTLLGMQFEADGVSHQVLADSPFTAQASLENLTDIDLTGLTASVEGAPSNWDVQVTLPSVLAGDGTNQISYTIFAPNASPIIQDQFDIRLTSAEGATAVLPVDVDLQRIVPNLVADVPRLSRGMLRGDQTAVEFTVTNEGGAETGDIQVNLPSAEWLSLATPPTIESLAPGESAEVTLLLTPEADLPLTVYEGNLFLDAPGSDGDLSMPFDFRAISEGTGSLEVSVINELFYFTEEAPKLEGARVVLRDYFTGEAVVEATTGADGEVSFGELAEGAYTLEVRADKHEAFRQTVQIGAGEDERIQSFLSLQTVQYTWNVTPTEIEDRYTISVESVFETNVPAPVVTVDPPSIDFSSLDVVGEVMQIDMTFTNHGLITANDVGLSFGNHPYYEVKPLLESISELPAKSSFKIPVQIKRVADFDTINPQGGEFSTQSDNSVPCGISASYSFCFDCGPYEICKQGSIAINGVDGNTDCGIRPTISGSNNQGNLSSLYPVTINSVASNCDPCIDEMLEILTDCVLEIAPLPDWQKCLAKLVLNDIRGNGDVESAMSAAQIVLDCSQSFANDSLGSLAKKAAKKSPIGKYYTFLKCVYDLIAVCNDLPLSGDILPFSQPGSTFSTSLSSSIKEAVSIIEERAKGLQNMIDFQSYIFGDKIWLESAQVDPLIFNAWVDRFQILSGSSIFEEAKISNNEQKELLGLSYPSGISSTDINRFLDRWNRSVDYWQRGVLNSTDVSGGDSQNFIAIDIWNDLLSKTQASITKSEEEGFAEITDGIEAAISDLEDLIYSSETSGVCAKVRINIDQDTVMTRSAFLGELEIENSLANIDLENVTVDLRIVDAQGNDVTERFGITDPILDGLTGVNGSGTVFADSTGSAEWTFIPTRLAAPDAPTEYTIGGTLSYEQDGQLVTVPLISTPVTVYPQAELHLDYFQERNVYGDDPFTDETEVAVPFSLGVLVRNEGGGTAQDLSIESAQPKIIENEKGLLVDFEIIGTQIGTESVQPTLTADFGNIAPGETAVADWLLKSSIQGKFIEYDATFEHINDLGIEELSLIKEVNIHELVRKVRVDHPTDDQLSDFLVNGEFDANFYPDILYFSDGTTAPVSVVDQVVRDGLASFDDLEIQLTATTPDGWTYLRLDDPGDGQFQIDQILRSDGTELRSDNYWTSDRTFPATGRPTYENILHILDYDSTGSYTVIYSSGDDVAPQVREIIDVDPDPRDTAVNSVEVIFTEAIRPDSFDYQDLSLTLDNGSNLITDAVTVAQIDDNHFRINGLADLTGNIGSYTLSVNATGIQDLAGTAGVGSVTENWLFMGDRPAVLSIDGLTSSLRSTPVDSLEVTFTEAILPGSFDFSDILLTREGGGNLSTNAVEITPLTDSTYRVSNLGGFTDQDGDYELLITADGIEDTDGNSGIGGRGFNWTLDTGAPAILEIAGIESGPRRSPVQSLEITFSEAIDPTSFDLADLALTRDGSEILIPATATLTQLTETTYRLSGLEAAQPEDGAYTLTVNGASIQDEAGNAVTGLVAETWQLDTTAPSPVTNLTISPDRGVSDSDLITNTDRLTVTGTLSEPNLSVFLVDKTRNVSLGQATVTDTTFTHEIQFPTSGSRQVEVQVVDAAGNTSGTTFNLFIDLAQPAITALTTQRLNPAEPVEFFDVEFSEPINLDTFDISDLSLTRDGSENLMTDDVTITHLGGSSYRIGGLSDLTEIPGTYELAVSASTIEDRAGNSGTSSDSTVFVVSEPLTPGILIAQSGGSTDVTEGSAADTYNLVLQTQPTDDVIVTITASDQLSLDATTLTFTSENWNIPQSVTVSAVDDIAPEAAQIVSLGHTVSSSDTDYDGLTLPDVAVNLIDNDVEIRGTVWNDLDGDRIRGAGEAGLEDWTVYLDANANGELDDSEITTQTAEDGSYTFTDLRPGTYTVGQVVQEGWQQTFPSVTTTASSIELFTPSKPEELALNAAATSAGKLINLDDFRQDDRFSSITGKGFTSVIIDTGIDLDHPFFGPDEDGDGVSDRIVYQYDFADNDSDASDQNGHGSHVASIIGSSDDTYGGIAPDADLIALKVFKDNGSGYFSDLEESLQWVINNADNYNIASVNLSLGDEKNWTSAAGRYGIGDELAVLTSLGLIVTAAAGNNFAGFNSAQGVAYPAADPNAIAVGAVISDTDQIADFSQRHPELGGIFAPGIPIVGADANGGIKTLSGTSQAAPHVAGIAILAQQLAVEILGRKLTVKEFDNLLTTTGVIINDGDDESDAVVNTGLDFSRVDMQALAEAILELDPEASESIPETSQDNATDDPLYLPNQTSSTQTISLTSGQTATGIDFGNQQLQLPNTAPQAEDDLATTKANTSVVIDVLANDTDVEGDPLSLKIVNEASYGQVIINANGTITYTPISEFVGSDSFSYEISDGILTDMATVDLSIEALPILPSKPVPLKPQAAFFDYAQSLRFRNLAALVPQDTFGGLPLAELFDASYYLAQNSDVAAAVGNNLDAAYQHFVQFGIKEGRNPSALFNEGRYLEQNPDVAQAVKAGFIASGLEHFLLSGHKEQRDPSQMFDQSDYLTNNPDVAAAVAQGFVDSAFAHYTINGIDENRLSTAPLLFNEAFYLKNNPDIAVAVTQGFLADGFEHFARFGQREGRAPSELYNEASYLALNPDVNAAVASGALTSGFQHYELFGRFEGRTAV